MQPSLSLELVSVSLEEEEGGTRAGRSSMGSGGGLVRRFGKAGEERGLDGSAIVVAECDAEEEAENGSLEDGRVVGGRGDTVEKGAERESWREENVCRGEGLYV
jgi:hypothetical protein